MAYTAFRMERTGGPPALLQRARLARYEPRAIGLTALAFMPTCGTFLTAARNREGRANYIVRIVDLAILQRGLEAWSASSKPIS